MYNQFDKQPTLLCEGLVVLSAARRKRREQVLSHTLYQQNGFSKVSSPTNPPTEIYNKEW
jgi:hypothetical protein